MKKTSAVLICLPILMLVSACNPSRPHLNPYDPEGPDIEFLVQQDYYAHKMTIGKLATMHVTSGYYYDSGTGQLAQSSGDPAGERNIYFHFPLPDVAAGTELRSAQAMGDTDQYRGYADFYSLDQPFGTSMSWGAQPAATFLFTISPTAQPYGPVIDMTSYFAPRFKGQLPFHGFVLKARSAAGWHTASMFHGLKFVYKPH